MKKVFFLIHPPSTNFSTFQAIQPINPCQHIKFAVSKRTITVAIVLENKFARLLSAIRHNPPVHSDRSFRHVPHVSLPGRLIRAPRSLRRFQLRSNRKRRKRIFGMIRTSRSHPSDVSQKSSRPSMSCLPLETNKRNLGDGRSQSCGCLSRVIRTVRWSDHRYLAVGWDSQLRWRPCKYCPSTKPKCCC
jgi:hypothetical protein